MRVRKEYVPEGYLPDDYFSEDYLASVPEVVIPVVVPSVVAPETPVVSIGGLAAIMTPSMDSRWWRWLYERRRKKTLGEMYTEIWGEEDELAFLGVL